MMAFAGGLAARRFCLLETPLIDSGADMPLDRSGFVGAALIYGQK
jgi:hypothetical protein